MRIPKKISIANIPTPVQKINFDGKKFLIKRDDLTGVELSGNKVRKLEFLIAEARRKKSDYIFTCGGEQSNHCRATAIAAAMKGIKSRLYLWGSERKHSDGNLFLDKLIGSEIVYLSKDEYLRVNEIMMKDKASLEAAGKKAYIIPEGGSSALGIWGYINFIKELSSQIRKNQINGIITAAGSGGTSAGLLLGSLIYDFPVKIFAVNVLYNKNEITQKVLSLAHEANERFKLNVKIDSSKFEVIDGYSNEGYKHIEDNKIEVILKLFRETGILTDPAYTGKAFYAFNDNFLSAKRTSKVLFVHTGGIFGVFGKKTNYLRLA